MIKTSRSHDPLDVQLTKTARKAATIRSAAEYVRKGATADDAIAWTEFNSRIDTIVKMRLEIVGLAGRTGLKDRAKDAYQDTTYELDTEVTTLVGLVDDAVSKCQADAETRRGKLPGRPPADLERFWGPGGRLRERRVLVADYRQVTIDALDALIAHIAAPDPTLPQ